MNNWLTFRFPDLLYTFETLIKEMKITKETKFGVTSNWVWFITFNDELSIDIIESFVLL